MIPKTTSFRNALLASPFLAVGLLALPAAAQPISGIYIGAGAGMNWLQDANLAATGQLGQALSAAGRSTRGDISFEQGWVGVVSLGYGFGNGVRTEIEGSLRQNEVDNISGFGGTNRVSGSSRSWGVMANALYDFDLGINIGGASIQPYLGVGAGYVWREFDDVHANVLGGTVRTDGTDGRFAYQGIAGIATQLNNISPGLALTAEYRYMGTLEHKFDTSSGGGAFAVTRGNTRSENINHSVLIGLRYAFGVTPPPPPVTAPMAPTAQAPAPARTFLIFFDFDRADLTDRARQIIADAAGNSGRVQTTRIEVSGHADRSGTPQYNQRLSERRAEAVAAELERRGITRGQISIQAFGESRPLVATADGVREPQNRRVEIVLR